MSALGAIVALLSTASGIGIGPLLHQPLAIAVMCGFIIALPLLLIAYLVLIILYLKVAEETIEHETIEV